MDESFDRCLEIERISDMPNSTSVKIYYFPPAKRNSGPILRIRRADGERFIAVIEDHPEQTDRFSLSTWPNPNKFLALPSAWLIDTARPDRSETLPGFDGHSVHYIFRNAARNVVLIGHCCGLYCYGAAGLLWRAENLFCCQDPILDVAGDSLVVLAHKHGEDPGETPTRKVLDLMTGRRLV